ncbi:hypothetical protein MNBD_GAMMA25-1831 [hydrothermal vent metagenome]|uniref:Uncharacterized protein n=1 Tax=hydrothermal vent metagenome TaxID=652676 RepID=A0A3B1AKJ1_9ZZZZ
MFDLFNFTRIVGSSTTEVEPTVEPNNRSDAANCRE